MNTWMDSFWRAAVYCWHPRVVLLSLSPLLILAVATFIGSYFFWEDALALVSNWLSQWSPSEAALQWLTDMGFESIRTVLAPLIVVLLATPVLVVGSMLLVAVLMTPAMVDLVAANRFPHLQRAKGGSLLGGALMALGLLLMALVLLILSLPLWLFPPMAMLIPPLIWGWLNYRIMSYDVLAEHASAAERVQIMKAHRPYLLAIGVVCGYLGAAPSFLWLTGALAVPLAPLLLPLAIWLYTAIFAFSGLWFSHYALAALQAHRQADLAGQAPGDIIEVQAVPK